MDNQEFDRIIRQKLEGLEPEYEPGSWASLAARMDAGSPPPSDHDLDQAVFDKMKAFEPVQPPGDWEGMRLLLDARQVRPQLAALKVLEAALLCVCLIFGVDLLLPVPAPAGPQAERTEPPRTLQPVAPANIPVSTRSASESLESSLAAGLPAVAPLPDRPLQLLSAPVAALPPTEKVSTSLLRETAALPAPATDDLRTGQQPDWPDYPQRKAHPLVVSMYGSFQYNRIFTPAGTESGTGTPAVKRFDPGYGGGITLGMGFGRWEVGTGLEFNAYSYQPRQIVYLSGSLKEGLYGLGIRDVEINTLGLPLYARYDLLRHKNWRLFAQGGLNLQVAFEANYFLADAGQLLNDPALSGRPPGEGSGGGSRGTPQIVDKELTEGWFEGGSFQDNAFMTGHLGVGLEYFPSPEWSLFLQPAYRPYLFAFDGGIGPDRDRISSFSLQAGLRIPLKR